MMDKKHNIDIAEILETENQSINNDVITRTIIKLIGIEKEAMYGSNKSKKSKLESVIKDELLNYIRGPHVS